jgi:diaminopimelate epimerase
VETQAGIKTVRVAVYRKKVKRVKVNMGTPAFAPEDIPVSRDSKNFGNSRLDITPIIDYPLKVDDVELSVSLVSLGNPHAVMFTTEPVSRFPLALIGPKVESHPLFPERINFEIARVLDERTIEVRVWERGAGETLSCGSGACAVATIARHKRLVDKPVDIILPGGKLSVTWAESGEVLINGPVEEIFIGQWLK